MRRKPGFTIVELVIATAIIVMVLAVSLPRFISYNQRQDFAAASGDVLQCLRSGQKAAASPVDGVNYRYSSVYLNASTSTLTCSVRVYNRNDTNGFEVTAADLAVKQSRLNPGSVLLKNVKAPSVHLSTVSSGTFSIVDPALVVLFFGSSEKGVPVLMCAYTTTPINASLCPNPIMASNQESGFRISFGLSDVNTLGLSTPTAGTISVNPLGVPINFESN